MVTREMKVNNLALATSRPRNQNANEFFEILDNAVRFIRKCTQYHSLFCFVEKLWRIKVKLLQILFGMG